VARARRVEGGLRTVGMTQARWRRYPVGRIGEVKGRGVWNSGPGGGVAVMGRLQAGCFGLGPIGTVRFPI
jgi:hypothetical protein